MYQPQSDQTDLPKETLRLLIVVWNAGVGETPRTTYTYKDLNHLVLSSFKIDTAKFNADMQSAIKALESTRIVEQISGLCMFNPKMLRATLQRPEILFRCEQVIKEQATNPDKLMDLFKQPKSW